MTRNTTASVDAFFGLVGQEWRGLFDEIRTREHKYVKPDKRLLLELAEVCVGGGKGEGGAEGGGTLVKEGGGMWHNCEGGWGAMLSKVERGEGCAVWFEGMCVLSVRTGQGHVIGGRGM